MVNWILAHQQSQNVFEVKNIPAPVPYDGPNDNYIQISHLNSYETVSICFANLVVNILKIH